MTIADLGNVGEFVGALLVVASLFYLALQIRQNTRAMRATSFQETIRSANASSALFVQDPQLGPLLKLGLSNLASLKEDERSQLDHLLRILIREYAAVLLLEREGFLPPGEISTAYEGYLNGLASPAGREWWSENRHTFAPRFHEYMDKLLAA